MARFRSRTTIGIKSTVKPPVDLEARSRRRRLADLQATIDNADEVRDVAEETCPVDSGYMRTQVKVSIGGDGDRFGVGFFAGDFVGKLNPFTGEKITVFYPPFPIRGTRFQQGNDFLTAANRATEQSQVARYREAAKTR